MNYFTCWVFVCMSAQGQDLVLWELCFWQVRKYTILYFHSKIFLWENICELPCPSLLSSIDPYLVRHLCEASHVLPVRIHTVNSCTVMYRVILHPVIQYSWAKWRLIAPYWMCNACTLLYSHISGGYLWQTAWWRHSCLIQVHVSGCVGQHKVRALVRWHQHNEGMSDSLQQWWR